MPDLLIRNIDPDLKRRIEEQARAHKRSLSEEAKALIRQSLAAASRRGLGTELFNLVPPEYRVDLDCEIPDLPRDPPDFS